MDGVAELRIHGVSNTPPASMLGLRAERVDGRAPEEGYGPNGVQVFAPAPRVDAHAFSWGGLTSGGWWKAFWLLLLPFVLVNAAGWALLTRDDTGEHPLDRWRVAVLRSAAVLATSLSVLLLHIVVVDLVTWQWLHARGGVGAEGAGWLRVGTLAVLAVFGGLWFANRVRPSSWGSWGGWSGPVERYDDLALRASLDDPAEGLWSQAGLIQRLRVVHLAAALGALGFATGLAGSGTGDLRGLPAGLVTGGAAVVVLAVLLVTWRSLGARPEPARFGPLVRALGVAGLVVGAASTLWPGPLPEPGTLPLLREAATGTAAVFALLIMGVLLPLELRARPDARRGPRRAAATGPALAMLGLVGIGAAGAGSELLAAQAIGERTCALRAGATCPEAGAGALALAITYAGGIVAFLAVGAVAMAIVKGRIASEDAALPPDGRPAGSPDLRALRRITAAPSAGFAWLLGLGFAGLALAVALVWRDPSLLRGVGLAEHVVVTVVAWCLPVVAGAWLLVLDLRPQARLAGVVLVAGATAYVASDLDVGLPIVPTDALEVLLVLGLTGPVGAVAMKAWAGLRSVDTRRSLGIAWDLGLFWPRWFHPFTPPTYSDTAVRQFRAQIRERLATGQAVLVSAHSQGTLIAVSTLVLMRPEELARVALITYGSPVGRSYAELFGGHVDAALLAAVRLRLTEPDGAVRWRNLHRITDPIGGPIVGADQPWLGDAEAWRATEVAAGQPLGDLPDPAGSAHSDYQLSPEYALARAELSAALSTAGAQRSERSSARSRS